jgi:hypothetical protein
LKNKETVTINLLDVRPLRLAKWETTDDGKVVVLVPKFKNPFLVKWVLPVLAKPYFRIKLDAIGSVIWKQCDGTTPVSAIMETLRATFGETVEPVDARITSFFNHLERGDLLTVERTDAAVNHSPSIQ